MSDTDALTLPLPSLPCLVFRHILGVQDAEGMRAVHDARAALDGVDPHDYCDDWPSLEGLRVSLAGAVDRREQSHWLVAEGAGEIVGYCQIASRREDDGNWVYLHQGWVAPAWRGQGIGTALLQWCEARIRALAAAERPGARWEFAANASSTEVDATALLLHEGYTAPYHVLSLALDPAVTSPEAALPPGIDVRPVLPEHLRLIAASIGEAYADQPVVAGTVKGRYDEAYDPVAYAADLAMPRYDPALWQVAWDGANRWGRCSRAWMRGTLKCSR